MTGRTLDCWLPLLLLLAGLAFARNLPGTTYDQRQEGKVNVQIDVKDVQILALVDSDMLEDYTNYDYAYDYADFTIKPRPTPSRPTTSSTTNLNSSSDTTPIPSSSPEATSTIFDSSNTTTASSTSKNESASNVTIAPTASSNSSSDAPTTRIPDSKIIVIPVTGTPNESKIADTIDLADNEATTPSSSSSVTPSKDARSDGARRTPEPRRQCPAGFFLKSGRCFKRRLSIISPRLALMRLAPALLAKSGAPSGFLT